MFTYEIFTNETGTCLYRYSAEGIRTTIPMIQGDSDYAEYLRYTEWVEAGNDPDEFWSQSEDFLTLSESNETEVI